MDTENTLPSEEARHKKAAFCDSIFVKCPEQANLERQTEEVDEWRPGAWEERRTRANEDEFLLGWDNALLVDS